MKYTISAVYDDEDKKCKIEVNPTPPNTLESLFDMVSALMAGTIHIIKTCVTDKEIRAGIMKTASKAFAKFSNSAIEEEQNE